MKPLRIAEPTKWTPLARAQARLDRWEKILLDRRHAKNMDSLRVGQITIGLEPDHELNARLIAEAEAAVQDWAVVVAAVRAHAKEARP